MQNGRAGPNPPRVPLRPQQFPAVLGHEGAGIVDAIGAGVTSVKPGDKVLLSFNSCGQCRHCEDEHPAYCQQFMPLNMLCVRGDGSTRNHVRCRPDSREFCAPAVQR